MIYMSQTINNKTKHLWRHEESAQLDEYRRVDSAIAISDYYSADNNSYISFEIIEFYPKGDFEIKRITIDTTNADNTRKFFIPVLYSSLHS